MTKWPCDELVTITWVSDSEREQINQLGNVLSVDFLELINPAFGSKIDFVIWIVTR
jgi:hypothetical protein